MKRLKSKGCRRHTEDKAYSRLLELSVHRATGRALRSSTLLFLSFLRPILLNNASMVNGWIFGFDALESLKKGTVRLNYGVATGRWRGWRGYMWNHR